MRERRRASVTWCAAASRRWGPKSRSPSSPTTRTAPSTPSSAAFAEIKRLEDLMTTWRDDTEVSRINAAAGHRAGHGLARDARGHREARRRRRSSPAASSTSPSTPCTASGSSTRISSRRSPTADEIKKRAAAHRLARIDRRPRRSAPCFSTKKGMGISLGGIAKGYAVDRAARCLREARLRRRHRAGGRRPDVLGQQERRAVGRRASAIRAARAATFRQDDADRPRLLDGGRLRALLHPRRQALPPHHRSAHRLPGDRSRARSPSTRPTRSSPTRSTTRSSSSAGRRASR